MATRGLVTAGLLALLLTGPLDGGAQGPGDATEDERERVFVEMLRREDPAEAERKYAETSLALLDFLDARDRRAMGRYQEEIARIGAFLEERQRTRVELEKLRSGE